jgi:Holliday junction resolvase RusA-like endonuclease
MREYRLIIPGKAVSFRTGNAKDYKRKVEAEDRKIFKQPIIDKRVEMRIDYFHRQKRRMDMDNVAKCIMDALNTVAYSDDKQVSMQKSVAHPLNQVVRINEETIDIVKPLAQHEEYVIVRIRELD